MNLSRTHQVIATVLLLLVGPAPAQPPDRAEDPVAAEALARVILERDFDNWEFQKADVVTMRQNDRVPGLNGLAFVYYKNAAGPRVELVVQWFENKDALRAFFDAHLEQQGLFQRRAFADLIIWSAETPDGAGYMWTDDSHFVISMAGSSIPLELVEAYLDVVPSRVASAPPALPAVETAEHVRARARAGGRGSTGRSRPTASATS